MAHLPIGHYLPRHPLEELLLVQRLELPQQLLALLVEAEGRSI